jgi:hypothetical protein
MWLSHNVNKDEMSATVGFDANYATSGTGNYATNGKGTQQYMVKKTVCIYEPNNTWIRKQYVFTLSLTTC